MRVRGDSAQCTVAAVLLQEGLKAAYSSCVSGIPVVIMPFWFLSLISMEERTSTGETLLTLMVCDVVKREAGAHCRDNSPHGVVGGYTQGGGDGAV